MEQFINEIWKPIVINPVYLVSNYGRVKTIDHPVWCKVNNSYSIRKGRLCTLSNRNSKKYWRVGIQINNKQKQFAVHRLVAEAFIPNPDNLPQVNHIDGNKNNNHVSNLEWCNNNYNMHHALEHGLIQTIKQRKELSETCWMRKLNYEQILFIRNKYNSFDFTYKGTQKMFCSICAEMFKLKSPNTILWICNNGTSKFINQDIVQTTNFENYNNQFNNILNRYLSTRKKSLIEYANELGVKRKTFYSTYRRLGKNLEKTIEYYKNKSNENYSGKENITS